MILKNRLFRYIKIFILLILICLIPNFVNGAEITKECEITLNGKKIDQKIVDNKENTFISISKDTEINIKSENNINGIYIIYEYSSKEGTISANDKTEKIGKNGFLHEYINVKDLIGITNEIKLKYNETVKIAEIYVLGEGEIPDFVEVWNKPCDRADLVLFSTHSDDEQLFFLGLLPTYVARGAYVQVVYFANHNDAPSRLHEQLHGLYTVGIRNYPIMGLIPDSYSKSLEGAITNLKKAGITEEDAIKFQVEMIRRFKPQVVVGHDEKGEYSHGQHILNTYCLEKAIKYTNDANYDQESADKYGIWEAKKVYLHLYPKNEITMDYDTPLEYFNGKTAYEVSKEGYKKHNSPQWTWFTGWINGKNTKYTKATQIETYSPLKYGLYYTTVGVDTQKNDMFENIIYYKDQEKKENKNENIAQKNKEEYKQENNKKNYTLYYLITFFIILILLIRKINKQRKHKKRIKLKNKAIK